MAAICWPCVHVITSQSPEAGAVVRPQSSVLISVRRDGDARWDAVESVSSSEA